MKYKLMGIAAVLVMAATVGLLSMVSRDTPSTRYHQHLEEPGYTPCTDHKDDIF